MNVLQTEQNFYDLAMDYLHRAVKNNVIKKLTNKKTTYNVLKASK